MNKYGIYWILFFCFLYNSIGGYNIIQRKIAVIQKLEQCRDDLPWKFYGTVRRFNRTHQSVTANVTMSCPLNDSMMYDLEVRIWGDGGWKNNAIKLQKTKACSTFMFVFGEVAKDILKSAKIPHHCPLNKNSKKIAVVQRLEECKRYSFPWRFNAVIRRYNRTHQAISANTTMSCPLDDSMIFDLEARIWGDGGWKNNAIRLQKTKACSTFMLLFGEVAKDILRAAKIPRRCPVAKGFYETNDYFVDASKIPFLYKNGKFNIISKVVTIKNKLISCINIILSIEDVL